MMDTHSVQEMVQHWRDGLPYVRYGSTVLAGLWLCLTLFRVWMGWGTRQLYAGPVCADIPAEPVWSVCLARLGVAAMWTGVIVAVMLMLSVLGRGGTGPIGRITTESAMWLMDYGWWVAFITFAWNAARQLDGIWENLNRTTQDTREE